MVKPLFTNSEWDSKTLEDIYEACLDVAENELGLNLYPNEFHIISSEQMLDAYSSIGLPVMYKHWSFGKSFIMNEHNYKTGKSGLAYEMVINSNPCINYLIEENTVATQTIVTAHAACVSGDTEFLTPTGWKPISQYEIGDKVGQYNHEDNTVVFVEPERYIKRPEKEFIHVESTSIDQAITEDHIVPFLSGNYKKFNKIDGKELETRQANKTRGFNGSFITAFNLYNDSKLELTDDEIKLHIAIKADGYFADKSEDKSHWNYVDYNRLAFHLKRKRKIERLEKLLKKLDIEYVKTPSYDGRYKIRFNIPKKIDKYFNKEWYNASYEQRLLISEEVLYWDGHATSSTFFSKNLCDVEYIQWVWASTGNHAHIGYNQHCYCVHKTKNKLTKGISRHVGNNGKPSTPFKRIKSLDGFAYCFTVPSGMFVTRRNNKITVTGNCGHNHFFKNNYMFKEWTDADGIIDYLMFAKDYINKCEEKYGATTVELFLDSVHALKTHGVDRYKRPPELSHKEEIARQEEREEQLQQAVNILWKTVVPEEKKEEDEKFPEEPEENILKFVEKNAPNLKTWQRELIRIVRRIQQYFYPQAQTKIMNEGFACYTHMYIMNRLYEKGLLTDGAMMEYFSLNGGVIGQHPFTQINPYALGLNIFKDIERICTEPTEEDKEWFPNLIGKNYVDVIKDMVENYRDESFIRQFLSPKVIRDMKLFSIVDHDEQFYQVKNIHNNAGYIHIRRALADQHNIIKHEPDIQVINANIKGDRILELQHNEVDEQKLDLKQAEIVLKHLKILWGFDVKLHCIDSAGGNHKTLSTK